jgi:hypothetical protein
MAERDISIDEVKSAVEFGEIIECYENDMPFPSRLMLHRAAKAIHVVCAESSEEIIVITTYVPSLEKWEGDLKTRKKI